jgi:hypothetical protein
MKIIFIILLYIFVSPAYAEGSSISFCSDQDIGWSTEMKCLTSCGRLRVNRVYTSSDEAAMNGNGGNLGDESVGFCTGQATTYKNTIYKIEMGNAASGYKCTVFEGTMVVDTGNATTGEILYSGKLKNDSCNSVIYDVLYITQDRKVEYAGFTTYPDGSGKIARTNSYCATDNLSIPANLSWLDVMVGTTYQDSNRCYLRQSTSWNGAWKKAASSPTTNDFTSSSNQIVEYDDWKGTLINALKGPAPYVTGNGYNIDSEGYYLEYGDDGYGQKLDPSNSDRLIVKIPTSAGGVNLFNGRKLKEHKEITKNKNYSSGFKLKISKYASKRNSEEFGLKFYFQRSGTTAKFIGTKNGDPGLYIQATQPD